MLINNDSSTNARSLPGCQASLKSRARAIVFAFIALLISAPGVVFSGTEPETACEPVETKSVKIEGWISKKFKKDMTTIVKEFGSMGHTQVDIKPFPMGEASGVIAIGRCIPAHIARHLLENTFKYTVGVTALVNQSFVSPHWFGIGTTIFDEPSQKKVTEEQAKQLLNSALTTEEFHALYRKLSLQDDNSERWGRPVPNIKRPDRIHDSNEKEMK